MNERWKEDTMDTGRETLTMIGIQNRDRGRRKRRNRKGRMSNGRTWMDRGSEKVTGVEEGKEGKEDQQE